MSSVSSSETSTASRKRGPARTSPSSPFVVVVGDGFMGRHIAAAAAARPMRNRDDVLILSRSIHEDVIRPDLEVRRMDATDDRDVSLQLRAIRAANGNRPIVVVHAGGMARPGMAQVDPGEAYKQNVTSTEILQRASKEIDATLMYLSTCYVFDGIGDEPRGMNDEPNPIQVYGETKAKAERRVEDLIVRLPAVYGPLHRRGAPPSSGLLLATRLAEILKTELGPDRKKVHTSAGQRMQFADVQSVAEAIATLATSIAEQGSMSGKRIVHAVPSQALSWRELIQGFARTMNPELDQSELDALVVDDFVNEADTTPRPASPLLIPSPGLDLPGADHAAPRFLESAGLFAPSQLATRERGFPAFQLT